MSARDVLFNITVNSNYPNLLTVYDRLLGTYTPSVRAGGVRDGLDDAEEMGRASFTGLVGMPFRRRERPSPAQATATAGLLENG